MSFESNFFIDANALDDDDDDDDDELNIVDMLTASVGVSNVDCVPLAAAVAAITHQTTYDQNEQTA